VTKLARKRVFVTQKKIVKQRGRPRKDGRPRPEFEVTRRVEKLAFPSTRKIARQLHHSKGTKVHRTTVARDLHASGLSPYIRPKAQRLMLQEKQRRLAFCQRMLKLPSSYRKSILFSDEKWFDSNDAGHRVMWLSREERDEAMIVRETEEYAPKCFVWAVIGVGFRRIVACDWEGKGMDDKDYIRNCVTKMGRKNGFAGKVFMQDGARIHWTQPVLTELKKYRGMEVLHGWPAHSPDLNPIERLWSILQSAVSERGPWTKQDLERFAVEEFMKVPQDLIDHLVLEFTTFCERCVEKSGAALGGYQFSRQKKEG